MQRTQDIGVDVELRTEVNSLERHNENGSVIVHTSLTKEIIGPEIKEASQDTTHSTTIEADMIVHGAGRVPDIGDLQLDVAEV